MKEYRVCEGNEVILETDDREKAFQIWRERHHRNIQLYHEIFQYWEGRYNGIAQFKPGDRVRW